MFKKERLSLGVAIIAIAGISLMGFQNCSKAKFTPDSDALTLRTQAQPIDDPAGNPQSGDDGQTPAASPTPASNPSPTPVVSPSPASSPTPSGTPPLSTTVDDGDLVECQILHPNNKVVLASDFEMRHSNSSSIRVCMSRRACLEVVNEYAASHKCTLQAGPGAEPADPQLQCTEIFPGSKGTCHNARKLTEQQVADQLNALLNVK